MEESDYILEVRILNYSMDDVEFEAIDLTTGKKYKQCFPDWIYQFTKDYINDHTRFIKPPDAWRVAGNYSIGWFHSRFLHLDASVIYHPCPAEQAYLDAINS